ncbi:MAG: indole-3-glycerol phosphate synthase TrpC [Candidatus Promineifilaceae bacterium]|jgi:indole-3-glycerol phosphate synthase
MSVSKVARRRGEILDEIMAYHRDRLPKVMREVPLEDLRAFATVSPPAADFYQALKTPGVALIAECKKASPSRGLIAPHYDPQELAQTYIKAGARAISVLTDRRHFQGSLDDLRTVKEAALDSAKKGKGIPILRKDFIFHPYQVYEARVAGADAILLITRVLSDSELGDLLGLAHKLGMQALVEVHSEEEMVRALAAQSQIIGVNNRNLQTFEVDFANTARLRDMVPAEIALVGESGIKTEADIQRMKEIGVDAVLVGETLMRSKDVYKTARALVTAGQDQG